MVMLWALCTKVGIPHFDSVYATFVAHFKKYYLDISMKSFKICIACTLYHMNFLNKISGRSLAILHNEVIKIIKIKQMEV